MEQAKVKFDSCEISYIQSRQDGIPVIFLHENSLSAVTFKELLNSDLGEKYRLIAFDLPGHGESKYSDNPVEDYSLPGLVSILKKIAIHLFAENAVFIGHGLGGFVILEALEDLTWARGICIFGTPLFTTASQIENVFYPQSGFESLFKGQLSEEQIDGLVNRYVIKEYGSSIKELIKKTDYRFRKYYGNWIRSGEFINQKEFLTHNQTPVAIFHGENDNLVNLEYIFGIKVENLWKNEIQLVPDSTHSPQIENPQEFKSLISNFLKDLTGV